jgi:hypothetical protein
MAPLLGLLTILCGLWFLLGMPTVVTAFGCEYRRSRKMNTGFVVSVVMLVVFYMSAALIWRLGSADWRLSFTTTLEASVNAEKYGHAIEHTAETMIVWLLMFSTIAALIAGATTAVVHAAIRRRNQERYSLHC